MLLDIGEDHPREPEQLVEALARLLVEQRAVLVGEPIALADDLLGRPLDLLAVRYRTHVPDERRVRDARVVEPASVVVVEPVPGGHVEPRSETFSSSSSHAFPASGSGRAVVDLQRRATLDERRAHPCRRRAARAWSSSASGTKSKTSIPATICDVLVGDVREDLLAEIGRTSRTSRTRAAELAVVLPGELAAARAAARTRRAPRRTPCCGRSRTRPRRARTRRAQGRESQRARRSAPPSSASTSRTARPSSRSSGPPASGRAPRARRSWRDR